MKEIKIVLIFNNNNNNNCIYIIKLLCILFMKYYKYISIIQEVV